MLTREAIDRSSFEAEQELQAMRQEMLTKANALFGYTRGLKNLFGINAAVDVAKALEDCGVAPYSHKSVMAYKKQQVRIARRRYALRNFANSGFGENFMFSAAFFGVLGILGSMFTTIYRFGGDKTIPWHPVMAIPFLLAGVLCPTWWTLAAIRSMSRHNFFSYDWKIVSLDSVPVPDFALSHAIQLKEAIPSANFHVEVLTQETERGHRYDMHLDPFLVMTVRDQVYYIDVWDEKAFEGIATKEIPS